MGKGKVSGEAAVAVIVMVLVMVGMGGAASICNIETSKLAECMPATSGSPPPAPTKACCTVLAAANLSCLCQYKSALPALGVNPTLAMALPKKCGRSLPPNCKADAEP